MVFLVQEALIDVLKIVLGICAALLMALVVANPILNDNRTKLVRFYYTIL